MLKNLVNANLEALSEFIYHLVTHEGVLNTHRLHKVIQSDHKYELILAENDQKLNDFSLGIGGEVANSFCSLYEAAYFFRALFMSAVGSYFIRKNLISKYRDSKQDKTQILTQIKQVLIDLTENKIYTNLQKPLITIVSSLDTDVAPVRYNKHHLWQLDPESFKYRVGSILPAHYNQTSLDHTFENTYWVEQDREIAQKTMQSGQNLIRCKAIQFYLIFGILCDLLGLKIENIPIYFNFLPREEIIQSGPDNSYLKVLNAVHTQEFKLIFRDLTRIKHPWFLAKSCPNCGMGSKRVISSKLMSDGRTVYSRCQVHEYEVRNENADLFHLKGCGHQYKYQIPNTEGEIYDFIKNHDITVHFSIRWLICLLKDTVDTPLGYVLGDIGIVKDSGLLKLNPTQIKGYGDHRIMLTSALSVQNWFLNSDLELVKELKNKNLLMPRPLFLYGNNQPAALIDPEITSSDDINTFVSDTSILKQLQKGRNIWEMFEKANLNLEVFDLEKLRKLKS